MVPMRSAVPGGREAASRTMTMPTTEHNSPVELRAKGMNIKSARAPREASFSTAMVVAMAMVAIMAPQ